MAKLKSRRGIFKPLVPTGPEHISFSEEDEVAYKYEFYIPAAVWKHTATRNFIQQLGQLNPGATIFKGATGVWKEDVEDVNIYVLILRQNDLGPPTAVRSALRDAVRQLMSGLAEWKESFQEAFLFTETVMRMSLTQVIDPDDIRAMYEPE